MPHSSGFNRNSLAHSQLLYSKYILEKLKVDKSFRKSITIEALFNFSFMITVLVLYCLSDYMLLYYLVSSGILA